MSKKITAIFLTFVMLAALAVGCGKTSETGNDANNAKDEMPAYSAEIGFHKDSYPIVDKQVNISVFGRTHSTLLGTADDWAKNAFWVDLEKKTNVHFTFDTIIDQTPNAWQTQMNLSFVSGDLPDIFMKSVFTKTDEINYGSSGQLVALESYIDKYMPSLKALMAQYPEVKKNITAPDGHIYTLPSVTTNDIQRITTNIVINKVWLDKLKLAQPKTIDEFYNVLVKFRNEDPNGNGQKDEIPVSLSADNIMQLMSLFGYWYGENAMFRDPKTDSMIFVPSTNEFKDYLAFMAKLYKEDLLDHDSFTQNNAQIKAKNGKKDTLVGVDLTNSPGLLCDGLSQLFPNGDLTVKAQRRESDYIFMTPVVAKNGNQIANSGQFSDSGKFAMTSECKYPEVVMRWMDYFYSQEGGMYFWAGTEGKGYKVDKDGVLQWLNADGSIATPDKWNDVRKVNTMQPGGNTPCIFPDKAFLIEKDLKPIKEAIAKYGVVPVPAFYFSKEQSTQVASTWADLKPYLDQFAAEVITGKVDLNAQWDTFQSTLKKMGSENLLKIYQEVYKNYKTTK